MGRPSKEHIPIALRMEKNVAERLNEFCDKTGMAKTVAIEKAVENFIDTYEENRKLAYKSRGNQKPSPKDEFYTQYDIIKKEIDEYVKFNPNVFKDKTVYLPCDEPYKSNFTKYFVENFNSFGLKKLISSCYRPGEPGKAQIVTIEDDLCFYLNGDGDFSSREVEPFFDEADIVITNGPFSLFKELYQIVRNKNKKFLLMANINSVVYKDIFEDIMNGEVWLGTKWGNEISLFDVPDKYNTDGTKAWATDQGKKVMTGGCTWITNIEHGHTNRPLKLKTKAEILRTTRHSKLKNNGFMKYENYDAYDVPYCDSIPSDLGEGVVMGVPLSYLMIWNKKQMEVVGIAKSGAGDPMLRTKVYGPEDSPDYNALNAGPVLKINGKLESQYARILIKFCKKSE